MCIRLLFVLSVALLAAGCDNQPVKDGGGGSKDMTPGRNLTPLESYADFQRVVLESNLPVLVQFQKVACPTCVLQEVCMDDLADEYRGRAVFAKMCILDLAMQPTVPEVKDQYRIFWVPTAILFVNGKERNRWELNHTADEFRAALNQVTAPAAH